ncbi:hypothetical protein [Rhodanobacter lindaniclasticus]
MRLAAPGAESVDLLQRHRRGIRSHRHQRMPLRYRGAAATGCKPLRARSDARLAQAAVLLCSQRARGGQHVFVQFQGGPHGIGSGSRDARNIS